MRYWAHPERKEQTAERIALVFEKFSSRVDVVNDETVTSADLAFARGNFRVRLTPKVGGDSQVIDRRFLDVWQKL